MSSKEIIKNKIAGLEDDYQHYTMVDKDKVKAHFIKTDIEEHQQILQDLEHKEQLEKENQDLKVFVDAYANARDELLIKNEQLEKEKQELMKLLEEHLEQEDIDNARLENENQELKEEYEILDRAYNSCHLDYEDVKGENEKLKNAIEILKNKDVDIDLLISSNCLEDYNYQYASLTQQEYELLKEVLEND